ncbi:hypothetical protein [Nocardioides sp.]|uniref:hypothetical protein n=1 Tax=Nocardioides sp. TaxID=35761 RepID=UPI003512EC68
MFAQHCLQPLLCALNVKPRVVDRFDYHLDSVGSGSVEREHCPGRRSLPLKENGSGAMPQSDLGNTHQATCGASDVVERWLKQPLQDLANLSVGVHARCGQGGVPFEDVGHADFTQLRNYPRGHGRIRVTAVTFDQGHYPKGAGRSMAHLHRTERAESTQDPLLCLKVDDRGGFGEHLVLGGALEQPVLRRRCSSCRRRNRTWCLSGA